jgi:hypothetical protein
MSQDALPDDGLKWFGEGFDGFPKRLPEDCVEYIIYVIDSNLRDIAATRTRLNQILKLATELCKKHTKGYIWQRDDLSLKLKPDLLDQDASTPLKPQPLHLRGRTNFGDSVADEWLIVYLLLELSKTCPDAWIRVYDTDGEFLLIEAANALPKWLNPEIAENRVWINNGHLRLIPLESSSPQRNLETLEALKFIQKTPDKLIISPFIEDEAFYRLRDYPAAISASLHHAMVTIPRRLAYLLHCNPAYVAPAIESFYLRDPISLKPLATKDISTLLFPPEDFVTISVKFTKVGYAQLRSQLFDAPPAWVGVTARLQDKKVEVGMKLSCGFDMLLRDKHYSDRKDVREMHVLLEDVESGEVVLPSDTEVAGWDDVSRQDGEEWMDIDYNDFEDELAGKKNDKRKKGSGFGDTGAQEQLRKMVSRFEDFLNDDEAGADGIDDDEEPSGDDDDANSSDATSIVSGEDKDGSFSEAEFERAMKEMMGMPPEEIEKSGLLDEARRLALEDAEIEHSPRDHAQSGRKVASGEDEEMRRVMEVMERELKGHGALTLDGDRIIRSGKPNKAKPDSSKDPKPQVKNNKPVFGPERPPNMSSIALTKSNGKAVAEVESDSDVGPGDGELSSDDEEFNDVDLGLAKNMLEAFKGQAGMSGPAGNLMRALGVSMPRDEGEGT